MNIEIANRLLEYRKKSGLSQEELAERLNISRQSVSKWERAETSPDTDNLIELAKIYGVTMDDLLNVDKPIVENLNIKKEEKKHYSIRVNNNHFFKDEENNVIFLKTDGIKVTKKNSHDTHHVSWDDIYVQEKNEKKRILDIDSFGKKTIPSLKAKRIKNAVDGVLILVITFLYILLCTLHLQEWHQFWIVFVAYPMIITLMEAIIYKDISRFVFPLLIAFIYLMIGLYFGKWNPYWFLFFLIPIYYLILDLFKKKQILYYQDENGIEHSFEINKGDVQVLKGFQE